MNRNTRSDIRQPKFWFHVRMLFKKSTNISALCDPRKFCTVNTNEADVVNASELDWFCYLKLKHSERREYQTSGRKLKRLIIDRFSKSIMLYCSLTKSHFGVVITWQISMLVSLVWFPDGAKLLFLKILIDYKRDGICSAIRLNTSFIFKILSETKILSIGGN